MSRFPVALGLGSNAGPSRKLLAWAIEAISTILVQPRIASIYRTEAVSDIVQPHYLNTAVVGHTDLSPEALLALAKRLEQLAGRVTGPRNGPRTLDIDLLLYDQRTCSNPELTLPHARLCDRAFVLAPLSEIAAHWRVPPDGHKVSELLSRLGDLSGVEFLAEERL